jgi:hypothetical protein
VVRDKFEFADEDDDESKDSQKVKKEGTLQLVLNGLLKNWQKYKNTLTTF